MAAPTDLELVMVQQLKQRLEQNQDVLKINDKERVAMLLRFLRARDLNLNKAEEMLIKHFAWRRENDIDSLEAWTPPFCREKYPYEITGVDKDGCPEGMYTNYIRYVDQLFLDVVQAMRASSLATGRNVSQFIIIMVPDDLTALRQMKCRQAVEAVLETVRRFEANYPETLKRAFVVDTPRVFQLIFSVVRPLVNSKTLGKVTIAGGSKEWLPALLALIEPQHLPARLGGNYVSKSLVLNNVRIQTAPSSLQCYGDTSSAIFCSRNVPAGRQLSIEYSVPTAGTHLSWAFKTERWDIGFSILYDAIEVVEPFARLDSHQQLHSGSILCQRAGKYVLLFDNTYSKWRSKVVVYRVILRNEQEDNFAADAAGMVVAVEVPQPQYQRTSSSEDIEQAAMQWTRSLNNPYKA